MGSPNYWLVGVAFLLGLLLTFALTIRRGQLQTSEPHHQMSGRGRRQEGGWPTRVGRPRRSVAQPHLTRAVLGVSRSCLRPLKRSATLDRM